MTSWQVACLVLLAENEVHLSADGWRVALFQLVLTPEQLLKPQSVHKLAALAATGKFA